MNMNTAGVTFNATMIVKLKKMYNNIKKFYIVNMYKSFLMIGKHGRSGHDPSFSQSYSGIRESIPPVIDDSVIHDGEQSAKYTAMVQNSHSTALSIMNRLFKRNLTKQVRKWHFGVFPERKIELLNTEYNTRSKDDYKYLAKLGAIECFSKTHQQMAYKAKVKAFRLITQNMYNKRSDDAHDEGLTEKLDLLNRQKALMEEIKQYKEENDALVYEIQNKDKSLRDANETVTILSLRINYMITQKFVSMIERVYESVETRHLNDGFDAMIDEANENFER